jgi:hypothetical protein
MRQILSLRKTYLLSFFVMCLFTFCTSPRVVSITAGNTTNDSLTMIDGQGNPADTIRVNYGEEIKWEINDPTSTVLGFDSLPLKPNKNQSGVLDGRPHKKFLSSSWVGKVKDSLQLVNGKEEIYNIVWRGSDGKQHTFDPRIIVNP